MLLSSVKNTIIALEQNISVHFFHPHWSQLRKAWATAVTAASEPSTLSRALVLLVTCIKPAVYNPVWHESLGHVRLVIYF